MTDKKVMTHVRNTKSAERLDTKSALIILETHFPDDFVSVDLEVSSKTPNETNKNRRLVQKCTVYCAGIGSFEASTWEGALAAIEMAKNGEKMVSF